MTDKTAAPIEESAQGPIVFLPGHAFFVDLLEAPISLEAEELENLAELSLESLSPFPIDQLCWGFIHSKAAEKVLLYATHQERLEQLGYADLEHHLWVFPDFVAPVLSPPAERASAILLESEQSWSLIQFDGSTHFPTSILSRQAAGEATEEPAGEDPPVPVAITDIAVSDKGLPIFKVAEKSLEDADAANPLHHGIAELWHADVRSPDFKRQEHNRRRMSAIIARLTAYAALLGLGMLCLEGVLLGGAAWSSQQEKTVEEQSAAVRRIEDKQSLINKLDQVAQSELRPIAMLEALNQNRPSGIYFTSTVTEGRNRITIDGIANTINDLNAYTESLRKSGIFELIGNPQSITRSGRTTFSVTLDYFHSEDEGESS